MKGMETVVDFFFFCGVTAFSTLVIFLLLVNVNVIVKHGKHNQAAKGWFQVGHWLPVTSDGTNLCGVLNYGQILLQILRVH